MRNAIRISTDSVLNFQGSPAKAPASGDLKEGNALLPFPLRGAEETAREQLSPKAAAFNSPSLLL